MLPGYLPSSHHNLYCKFNQTTILFNYVLKTIEHVTNLITIIVELLFDSSSNFFIINDPKLLHNLIPCSDSVGVTSGHAALASCKGTLYFLLQGNQYNLVVEVKNVPCITSNPHNGFPLLPLYDYGFKQVIHSTRDRLTLRHDKTVFFYFRLKSKRFFNGYRGKVSNLIKGR